VFGLAHRLGVPLHGRDINDKGLTVRWVTEACIGAALGTGLQAQTTPFPDGLFDGDPYCDLATQNFDFAKIFIMAFLTRRESRFTDPDILCQAAKLEFIPVEIITLCYRPVKDQILWPLGLRHHGKGLLR